jgi:hypothetical protein
MTPRGGHHPHPRQNDGSGAMALGSERTERAPENAVARTTGSAKNA